MWQTCGNVEVCDEFERDIYRQEKADMDDVIRRDIAAAIAEEDRAREEFDRGPLGVGA